MKGGAKFNTAGFDRVISQNIAALARVRVTVGLHRGKENKGVDVALYGAWNNFGTKNARGQEIIPSRPFMKFASERIADWMESEKYQRLLRDVIRGKITPEQAVNRIGLQAVQITRKTISDSSLYKPNSDITKARKRSSKPLIRDGVMLQTINFKAER